MQPYHALQEKLIEIKKLETGVEEGNCPRMRMLNRTFWLFCVILLKLVQLCELYVLTYKQQVAILSKLNILIKNK